MVKQREGYVKIIEAFAVERIKKEQCPSCALPKEQWKRRRDWTCCSVDCTKTYWDKLVIYNGWQDLREKAIKRDNYSCVKCNIKYPTSYGLIADHILPIALGGEEWDIDNVQTLCKECNKIKTRKDMGEIAKLRRVEKILDNGKQQVLIKEQL